MFQEQRRDYKILKGRHRALYTSRSLNIRILNTKAGEIIGEFFPFFTQSRRESIPRDLHSADRVCIPRGGGGANWAGSVILLPNKMTNLSLVEGRRRNDHLVSFVIRERIRRS